MNKYHINHEGKVYPCRARVLRCPYGDEMHADSKEELYYKVMKINRDVEPSINAKREIDVTGRLKSLHSASEFISGVQYPVEVAISTLNYAIERVKDEEPENLNNRYERTLNKGADLVHHHLVYGLSVRDNLVPKEIMSEAIKRHNDSHNGKVIEYAGATRNLAALSKVKTLLSMEEEFEDYKEYKRWGLTEENAAGSLGWLKADFYQFSHDLNTSKMMTQPVFYGNLKKAEQTIEAMDDFELLAAYDDYLTPDSEIIENVKMANNFEYKFRDDLSLEANKSMKRWYDRNKDMFSNWKNNTPKRVLLSVKMANELDKRGIYRQDNAVGRK